MRSSRRKGWKNPTKLLGQIAVITGAASGIARAIALLFAQEGATVLVADTNANGGRQTVRSIQSSGGRAAFAELDATRSDQVRQVVRRTVEELGTPTILVNGAGILAYGTAVETSEEVWTQMMAVNLTGTFLCCREVLPHMIERGSGAIVNIASTTGSHDACAGAVAYITSKAGVTLMSRAMAIDHAKQGVRVNVICPGPTDTPMLRRAMTESQLQSFARSFPMGRLGQPEEIAQAALFLASKDASFVTGAVLHVDGGQTAEV